MRKRLVGFALVAILVSSGGDMAGGGVSVYGGTLDVNPETVEPGDFVNVANSPGSECFGALVIGDITVRPGAWSTVPDESGNWDVDLQVPPNGAPDPMGNPTPFPPGEYEVHARCEATCPEGWEAQCGAAPAEAVAASDANTVRAAAVGGEPVPESFEYEPATITVVEPQTGGSPTTMTPTTSAPDGGTPTTAAGGAVQDAGAAAPVTAQPTFTG